MTHRARDDGKRDARGEWAGRSFPVTQIVKTVVRELLAADEAGEGAREFVRVPPFAVMQRKDIALSLVWGASNGPSVVS